MYRAIVVPLDHSPAAEEALPVAAAIAERDGAALHLITVEVPHLFSGAGDERYVAAIRKQATDYLDARAAVIREQFGIRTETALLTETVADSIRRYIADVDAGLVVLTSHGRTGFSRAWLGSVADAVVRHVPVPVLLIRLEEEGASSTSAFSAFRHVIVPLDGSPFAESAVDCAMEAGGTNGTTYLLVRVVDPIPILHEAPHILSAPLPVDESATAAAVEEARAYLARVAGEVLGRHAGVQLEWLVRENRHTARTVLELAREHQADLIALATHGRGASRLVMGSVADKLLRGSHLPVLLYHPST